MEYSGNSGSLQSSSGDEDYDSRPESAAAPPPQPPSVFLNPHHYQNHQQPPPPPTFFDISSSNNYIPHQQRNSNPSSLLKNFDLISSRTNKSLQGSSSSSSSSSLAPADHHQGVLINNHGRLLNNNDQITNHPPPKKRTRTSRRAPTTVLTTDTSNFRSMVQEFTGIPSQPFSVGLPYSRRLDLFKSAGNNLESMGALNYPLRPTSQKFQPFQAFVSSTSIDATTATSAVTTSISDFTNHNSSSCNYQLLSDLGLNINNHKETQNILNNFNLNPPLVSFQSLLQHSTFNPSLNLTGGSFAANESQGGSFGLPSFEDHHHHHHLEMINSHVGLPNNQDHLKSFEGNFGNSSQRVTSCKLNYSTSSTDFHHDKNLENVSSRGEGTVDSWICPSE